MLVDSSVWIGSSKVGYRLDDIVAEDEIAACPSIVQEVLRGTRTARTIDVTRLLLRQPMLDSPTPFERFEEAAQHVPSVPRRRRHARSAADCLIVACAIAHDDPGASQRSRLQTHRAGHDAEAVRRHPFLSRRTFVITSL